MYSNYPKGGTCDVNVDPGAASVFYSNCDNLHRFFKSKVEKKMAHLLKALRIINAENHPFCRIFSCHR